MLADHGAWGLVGPKGAGKSTTLAALAGHTVLADDLVVLEGGRALSGPRTLDLRFAAAERLEGTFATLSVRGDQRRRLVLDASVTSAPFKGWVCLGRARPRPPTACAAPTGGRRWRAWCAPSKTSWPAA